jgi:non-specific serine/threonine protein kinase
LLDGYPDGVWFVELASLSDARLVPQAVASVLGVTEEVGRPVIEALVKLVVDRRTLLILDNCEHLIDACADLARQLLQAGPHLKILASSREPLRLGGETTYPVPALATPDASQPITVGRLAQFEAVRLFAERATAAQPVFHVTPQNAAAVADICRRLDGIPLALELAAARMRSLSVESIAERLGDRYALLVGGDRTALPRQQTLRALIDWSHDLLTEQERVLFRRLSVFAGGFTLEGAEALRTAGKDDVPDALAVLSQLVEKSLVESDIEGQRYRLLETVRQYAQGRLDESGESDRVHAAHLHFYLAFVEKGLPELVGPRQGIWLARFDRERENLLLAHAWCDRVDDGAALDLRLVHATKLYWLSRGLLELGYRLTVEALARVGAQQRTLMRCRGLTDAGKLGCFMGRYAEASANLEAALSIAREIGDKASVASVLQPLGMAALGQGDVAAARVYLEEALLLARELGNKRDIAAALNALAQLHRAHDALVVAEPLYENVVALARELGDRESIAIGLLNLAMVSIGRGSAERARTLLLEVLGITEELGSRSTGQSVLEVSTGLAALRGESALAAHFFGAAEAQAMQSGLHRDPADEAFLAPIVAKVRAGLDETDFTAGESAGRALSYQEAIDAARAWLSRTA